MRRVYETLIDEHFLRERKMLLLMGPRQVGKTTTALETARRRERSHYLNWDNVDHQAPIVAGPAKLAEELGLATLRSERPLLVLDELHKYPQWRTLLKGFFDTYREEADVLVTGSARLGVFNRGGESLMGRYFSYRMHPLSLAELAGGGPGTPPGRRQPSRVEGPGLDELLRFGGYPEPLLRQEDRFARRWRRLRHQQLFREELRDLTRIQELGKVQTLAQLVVQRVGQLVRYTSLANHARASVDSIRRWLDTLESLYFCFRIRPWHRNVARALRKEPKLYLWDWSLLEEPGPRFENLVAAALLKAVHLWTDSGDGDFDLHFLRDKQKREVDFLVSRDGRPWLLVEAKSAGDRLQPSLRIFQDQTAAPHALQLSAELPYVDRDVFELGKPTIVPARTFLSQLV